VCGVKEVQIFIETPCTLKVAMAHSQLAHRETLPIDQPAFFCNIRRVGLPTAQIFTAK
jgi:hypothetical protein